MALVQVQLRGGVVLLTKRKLTLLLSLCHRVAVTACRRKVKHRIASPGRVPRARRPSSCFDVDNEKANLRVIVDVADGYADVCASAMMTNNDNDDDANDNDFDETLGEILGASFMTTPSLDLELAFGAVDSNVDLDRTHLFSPLSPLSSPLLLLLLLGSPSEIQEFSPS